MVAALAITCVFQGERALAQDDVMMQAFYWDVPVDNTNLNGTWWDNLNNKATTLSSAGITGIWVPSAAKGNFGIWDMGYGIYDLYDLGNYTQKNTTETRFGSRAELESMISAMHNNGVNVYMDVVLNHLYTGDDDEENNPAVKDYVFDEAFRNGQQYSPYPTNEITWVIPNAAAGDYYIQIHGYHLASTVKEERGYDLQIDFDGSGFSSNYSWESEPNNGGGNFDVFSTSGNTVRGHIEVSDVDEYKVTLSSSSDIVIKLTARKEIASPWEWAWANQTNGYYPKAVWYNGTNLANTTLQARTNTGVSYPNHTGTGEANFSWNYSHFHPVDGNDWLGYPGSDEIITNTKFFGNDLNTFSTVVEGRYQDWGEWLVNEIGFDGFRMDFVRGFQESYIADWVNNLPLDNGNQRFIVGEYWGPSYRIRDWVNNVGSNGATVNGFDFDLKFTLTSMMNGNQSNYDMRWLNNAGLVRNTSASLPGTRVVTWIENHDTGKEHDKWVTKDWKMGYAYILTHEGKPCVFYNHFFGDVLTDNHDPNLTVTPASDLDDDIKKLIFVRNTYLGGTIEVLSDAGNPYPAGDAYHVYAARRGGNGTKSGAIVVINNHDSQTKGLWVDAGVNGQASWTNQTLVNAFNSSNTTQVYSDGRVWVEAPPRGYAVYVLQSEYTAYSKTGLEEALNSDVIISDEFSVSQNFPNPFSNETNISFNLPERGNVNVTIYDVYGRQAAQLANGEFAPGQHNVTWEAQDATPGIYFYTVEYGDNKVTKRMMLK